MPARLLFKILILCLIFGCQPKPQADKLKDLSLAYQAVSSQSNPSDLEAKIKLAEFYYDFHDYQKVKELLKGSSDLRAKKILAKAYTQLKDYDYAIAVFEQIKPLPEDPEYLYLYGRVLEAKNLYPKALETYSLVEGSYKDKASARIKFIKSDHSVSLPAYIKELETEAQSFLSEISDEAAIILKVNEETEIRPDDTSISSIHVVEKVLKERGKSLAEVDIGYDSTYQRIELEFARTITEKGQVISVGSENIRDVSRYLNFPLYSNSRAFIISMPAVDVGSIIEYKLKIHSSKLVNKDNFAFIYRLREQYPVFKADFKLIVPKKKEVRFKYFNLFYAKGFNLEPVTGDSLNNKTYSWNFNKIDSIIPEHAMPPAARVNPAFAISSFSSWQQVYEWWKSLYQDKLELSQTTKDFAAELTKGQTSDFDKAKKLAEYVAKNIRYVAIEYGDSGYEPHKAEEVFLNRYGDCKDQAMLLVAMLRSQGLDSFPVLIPTRGMYPIDEDFASISFNHAICAVKIDEQLIFMDPTSETTPFGQIPLGDQNRKVLVFFEDGYRIETTPQSDDNSIEYTMDIDIDADQNAKITRAVATKGFFASSYRSYLKHTHPDLIKEDIRQKMASLASLSELISYRIENADDFDKDPKLSYEFSAEKFLNPAGNLRILPVLDEAYIDYGLISMADRKFPVDLDGLYLKGAKIKIDLPSQLKIKYLPQDVALDTPWFDLGVTYAETNGDFSFLQQFNIKKRFVSVEEYPEFKKELEEALYLLRGQVILERTSD